MVVLNRISFVVASLFPLALGNNLARARTPMTARVFDRLFSGGAAAALPTSFRALSDGGLGGPPTWEQLTEKALATPTGARLAAEDKERESGGGPPHRASKLRLFGHSPADVRITLYRDSAGARSCPSRRILGAPRRPRQAAWRLTRASRAAHPSSPFR